MKFRAVNVELVKDRHGQTFVVLSVSGRVMPYKLAISERKLTAQLQAVTPDEKERITDRFRHSH